MVLTRDQRLITRTYRDNGASFTTIQQSTGFSLSQICYTCRNNVDLTPQKRKSGRPHKLSSETLNNVIKWIQSSFERRCLTYDQVCIQLELPVCGETLRTDLKKGEMDAHPAAQKPPITAAHTERRLQWANERIHWPLEKWKRVIFSDEAWFQSGWYCMPWVHQFPDERFHETAVLPQSKQRSGIMVWACFCGPN
jgi:hypothetical protein